MSDIATWKRTSVGPYLYVCGLEVRSWLGTRYDDECKQLCERINAAYAERHAMPPKEPAQ